jgi:CrcB protein
MITMLMSVGAGGAFGAIARYLIGAVLAERFGVSSWVGTIVVNIAGCMFMGCLVALMASSGALSLHLRGFLAVGFLGALTTFSSYTLDGYGFWMRDELLSGFLYLSASVILSLGGFMLAYAGMRLAMGGGAWN